MTRFRKGVRRCDFGDYDAGDEIKDQMRDKCSSPCLCRGLLHEVHLNMDTMLRTARSGEPSETRTTQMEQNTVNTPNMEDVNVMNKTQSQQTSNEPPVWKQRHTNLVTSREVFTSSVSFLVFRFMIVSSTSPQSVIAGRTVANLEAMSTQLTGPGDQ